MEKFYNLIDILWKISGYLAIALIIVICVFVISWLHNINEGLKERTAEYSAIVEEVEAQMRELRNRNSELEEMPDIVEKAERRLWQCNSRKREVREEKRELERNIKEWKEGEEKIKELTSTLEELEYKLQQIVIITENNYIQ